MTGRRWWWALGCAVAVLALLSAVQIARGVPFGYDFEAYWSVGRNLAAGAPLYPAPDEALGQRGQFKYLPIVAVPFLLLAALPLQTATLVWFGIEIAIAAAVGVVLLGELPRDARPWAAAGYVLFLPLALEVTIGNLNLASVALMLLAWRLRDRPARAAIPLALGVGLKLLPAAMLLFYLAAGRWRVVALGALAGIAAILLTAPFLAGPLADYIVLFPRLGDTTWVRTVVERDEPAILADILWSTAFQRAMSLATVVGVVLLGWMSRRSRDETQLHNVALAISPYLAPFAFVWTTFLVMSLPLFASTLARVLALRGPGRALGIAGIALCLLLMDLVRLHDLVPIAAHFAGVLL
ncbi:MAG TPA: glycosyltransferase family 87 protein, partial [Candidatus Limnocylindria bacterium]|nr:glycosyltransferase family 87 protein [Candidatus Limnocylindria bacterium]